MTDDVLHSEDRCEVCNRLLDCCGLCPKHGGHCDWEEDR